jgi:hypothetical protein
MLRISLQREERSTLTSFMADWGAETKLEQNRGGTGGCSGGARIGEIPGLKTKREKKTTTAKTPVIIA